ncbi:MAG: hypothetical protein CMO34_05825 [Verrucomicrobia bacterium]|nr:hypothetical protein [Verrucomicrobiota bacterium]
MKKILFICIDGLTDPLGQSQIIPYFNGLSRLGHDVMLLSAEKSINLEQNRSTIEQILQDTSIKWEFIHYRNRPPLISSCMNYAALKRKAIKLMAKYQFDVVHCRSVMPAMIGHALKLKFGNKLIFDMRGFWADERIEGKLWNLKHPIYNYLYRFFKKKERQLFEVSDYIISLTENGKEFIYKHFNTKNNFQVIPCAADLNHFDPRRIPENELDKLRDSLGIDKDTYVLTYIGSLGTRYRLKDMLRFFKFLQQEMSNCKFLFVTKSDPTQITDSCDDLNISREHLIITSSNYQNIPHYIALADASIFFIVTSFSGKAVSPTKQAEVMGMGLPIVANEGLGDTDRILLESGTGVLIEGYDNESLENAVSKLITFNKSKEEVREEAMKRFALEHAIGKYAEVYQKL